MEYGVRPSGSDTILRPNRQCSSPEQAMVKSFPTRAEGGCRAVVVLLMAGLAAGACPQRAHADPDRATMFLAMLEGSWSGQAEVTPVGPRPYDMVLARTASGQVEGAAHPGRSIHTWTFFAHDGSLRLSFLTTFAGNRDPIQFQPARWIDEWAVFRAVQPDHLEVRVRPESSRLAIDVLLRERLHVSIRLERK